MTDLKAKIMSYYAFLDEEKLDEIPTFFSEDTVYKRCEDVYLGKPEVMEYLLEKRTLRGTHTILKLNQDEQTVIARGIFDGVNGSGENVRVFFTDFFTFNEDDLIFTRETYLALGTDMIR